MSSAVKFVWSAALLGLLCVVLSGPAQADTVFTYTDTYGGKPVSITFDTTLSGASLDNLAPGTNISGEVVSFSETNGIVPAPTDTAGFPVGVNTFFTPYTVEIGTDALGNISSFDISEGFFASYPAFPGESPYDFYCDYNVEATSSTDKSSLTTDQDAGFCPAGVSLSADTTGTWSPVFTSGGGTSGGGSTVPEPSSLLQFGGGLMGLLALAYRRKQVA
jgi:hypothetical protein